MEGILPSELREAILGSDFYEPRLASQLIAFVVDGWGTESLLELLRSLFTGDAPAAALSGVLGLLPRLDKEPGADRIKILSIVLEFRKAMDAGDYQACVDLYLQAVEAALGPLPPLPAGSSRR